MLNKTLYFIGGLVSILLIGCTASSTETMSTSTTDEYLDDVATVENVAFQESTEANVELAGTSVRAVTDEDQIIALYKLASPSVVNITSVEYVYSRGLGQLPEEGVGSGFVYNSDGYIVTNYHVVENADELIVTFANGDEYEATVAGTDAVNDLAILYVDAGDNLPEPLPLADSGQVQVGETVLAIGNPYGLNLTLTTGVVSALGRVIEGTEEDQFIAEAIQTDAAINPGNSGGPLLNLDGAVIGVNSQIISNSGSSAGVGFAISSNTVQLIAPELIANGIYQHPWLGLITIDLTDYSAAVLSEVGMDIPVEAGVLVVGLESGSPAQTAGISYGDRQARLGRYIVQIGGDIITAINDTPVNTLEDLMVYLEMQTSIGDTVQLTLIRNGQQQVVPVTLTAQPQDLH